MCEMNLSNERNGMGFDFCNNGKIKICGIATDLHEDIALIRRVRFDSAIFPLKSKKNAQCKSVKIRTERFFASAPVKERSETINAFRY